MWGDPEKLNSCRLETAAGASLPCPSCLPASTSHQLRRQKNFNDIHTHTSMALPEACRSPGHSLTMMNE
eukprot:scaffold2201_cov110-Isochrysis_galbana.AAC.3